MTAAYRPATSVGGAPRRIGQHGPRHRARAVVVAAAVVAASLVGLAQPASAARDKVAPTPPSSLRATPGDGRATLTWARSTDRYGVAGYRVHLRKTSGWTVVATVTSTSTVVAALSNATPHLFRVTAHDRAGNQSLPSPEVSVTPVAAAVPVTAPTTVECGFGGFGAGSWPTSCWRPYGASSPFNRAVPASPRLLANSQGIVDRVLGMGAIADLIVAPSTSSDWYHPSYYSTTTDPIYTVHCTKAWGTCEIEGMSVRIPAAARPASGGDAHMAVVDQAGGWEYDFWQVQDKPAGGGVLTISWGGRTAIRGDGLGSDATAAHFGLLAGVIRAPEMKAGKIDHALFMIVGCANGRYVYPAQGLGLACADTTNAPAIGQHFWLDMTRAEIDGLPVPGWKKTILRALSTYGAYVGDTGGNEAFGFQFESGATYTSFGVADPMVAFAQQQTAGVYHSASSGKYYFDLGAGVDWRGRMRTLDPCVSQAAC